MPSPIERELQSHAAALRTLARALVGAQHADDLVQDTAVQALQTPPQRPGPLGGWLASIVRHLASKHRRGEQRRRHREQRAARPESQPPDLAGDDRDSFRRLTQAVLALPEPYQTTLLLRYLRDLTPTEIAATTREPLRTVKTRLQRGLALLRADLDRDGSDWRRAFAAAFGFERLATAATITTGVLLMGTGAKLVAGGATAAALVAALWLAGEGAPETSITAVAGDQQRVAAAAATIEAAGVAPAEPAVREIAVIGGSASDPSLATFRGRCVDEHGMPLAAATVRIRAIHAGEGAFVDAAIWPPAERTTADDGLFAFQVAVADGMGFHLSLRHGDRGERSGAWNDVATGSVVDLGDVALLPMVTVTGRVVDTRNQPQAGVHITALREVGNDELNAALSADNGGAAVTRYDGTFEPFQLPAPGRAWATVDRRLVEGPIHRFALVPGRLAQLEIVVVSDDDLPPIRGVVVDENGQPLRDATVMLGGAAGVRVAADGTFVLRPTDAGNGPFVVRANANGFDEAQSGPHALGTTDVRLVLRRLPGLVVRVRAADTGEPVPAFAIDLVTVGTTLDWRHSRLGHQDWPGGVANMRAVEKGDHFIHVDPGHGPLASGTFVPVTIGDAKTNEVEVLLPSRGLRLLRLRADDGAPVSATVELLDTFGLPSQLEAEARGLVAWHRLAGLSTAVVLQQGEANARGEMLLDGPASHDLALRLRGKGIALQTVAPVRLDGDGPLEVTVQRGATWTGRLVPADVAAELFLASEAQPGQPDDGALGIELARPHAEFGSCSLQRLLDQACTCDAEGRFRIGGIPAGTWQVVVVALGKRYHCDEITVGEGDTLERDLEVANLRLGRLDLQVLVEGAPLAHGTICVFGECALGHGGQPLVTVDVSQLDASGRVELRTFAGMLTFHIGAGRGGLYALQQTVTAGSRAQQVIDVRRSALSMRLLTPTGQPAAGVPLQIGGAYGFQATTDAEGRIATDLVAAGRHAVRARSSSRSPRRGAALEPGATFDLGTIDVAPGANPEATLRLPPGWDR